VLGTGPASGLPGGNIATSYYAQAEPKFDDSLKFTPPLNSLYTLTIRLKKTTNWSA
jgi:hypothetical protein